MSTKVTDWKPLPGYPDGNLYRLVGNSVELSLWGVDSYIKLPLIALQEILTEAWK